MNKVMNVFAKAVVQRRYIPIEIEANDEVKASEDGFESFRRIRKMAESGQLPDMTLDEINEEIRWVRAERKRK